MSVPLWVGELAERFWDHPGEPPPFPRDLRPVLTWRFPFLVRELKRLRVATLRDALEEMGIRCIADEPDRALRACLVAQCGRGIAFVDADDPEDERRFSLAHEVAHFLNDHWHPRQNAIRVLGPAAAEVFDGLRPPTVDERLCSVLRDVPLGFHVHLMARDGDGRFASPEVRASEQNADRLAFELLAPADAVQAADRADAETELRTTFGLPFRQACEYAAVLFPPSEPPDPLVQRLRAIV